MFQEFGDNGNSRDDYFLNEFRQKLANQSQNNLEEKQLDMQRSKSVIMGVLGGIALASIVGWIAFAPKSGSQHNENVPVIRKPQAAVKIRPANPGGMEILNQDKSVYGIIDNSVDAQPNVETILPPPEQPMIPVVTPETISEVIDNIEAPEVVENTNEKPLEKSTTTLEVEKKPEQSDTSKENSTQKTAPNKEPIQSDKALEKVVSIPAPSQNAAIAAGSWQVQLMSSQNKKAIETSWDASTKKHSALKGLPHEIEEAVVNGSTYYRLKAGAFANKADADGVCNSIKAEGGSCIVKKK